MAHRQALPSAAGCCAGITATTGFIREQRSERSRQQLLERTERLAAAPVRRRVDCRPDGVYYSDEELTDDEVYGRLPGAGVWHTGQQGLAVS